MSDLINRACVHLRVWCPEGCHDLTGWAPDTAGMSLLADLTEEWANDGELDSFHAYPDPSTGLDGLDELVESNLLVIRAEGEDYDADGRSCQGV
jgi:hypothetical protein